MAKSTGSSFRGPRSDSQHPQGGSKPAITPVSRDLVPSPELGGCCMRVEHRPACRRSIHTRKIKMKERGKSFKLMNYFWKFPCDVD